jgi:hypothetical protein
VLAAIVLMAAIFAWSPRTGTVTVELHDAVSGSWIYDAEIALGDRFTRSFFSTEQQFSDLPFGTWEVVVSADGFPPVSPRTVELSRRDRDVTVAIEMRGNGIPDMQDLLVFERIENGTLQAEIRPVDSGRRGIVRHPAMPIAIAAAVWVQTVDGRPARFPTSAGAERGRLLLRDSLTWSWRDDRDDGYRYIAESVWGEIGSADGPIAVVDYIVVVADAQNVTQQDVDGQLQRIVQAVSLEDPDDVTLDGVSSAGSGVRVFRDTSWNVVIR